MSPRSAMTNCAPSWRGSSERRLLLRREERARRLRNSFEAFASDGLSAQGFVPAAHHLLLMRELQAVAEGRTTRLMVNMPPGSAKSTYASVWFPAWAMARRPGFDVIAASNIAATAEGFSRKVMGVARDQGAVLGYSLEREAVDDWTTTRGGRYRAVGVGGTIAGARADLALIDDPVKSREEAQSQVVRDRQWDWFTADLRTRLKPNAAIVVVMTRWHEDDLGGRLLASQPDLWRVVSLPAVAGADDPLGRAPGEFLWDDGYGFGAELRRIRAEYEAAGAMRDWQALFQQAPRAAEGTLFRTERVGVAEAPLADAVRVRAWDLAATAATGSRDADWTAGVKLARTAAGRFAVEDVVRLRGGPDAVEAAILATAARDGAGVAVHLPQDPGQAGKAQALYLARRLAGFRVAARPVTGAKAVRAGPFASQINVGNVSVLRGAWNRAFLDELQGFPGAAHDDQVDAASLAFEALSEVPEPARRVRLGIMRR